MRCLDYRIPLPLLRWTWTLMLSNPPGWDGDKLEITADSGLYETDTTDRPHAGRDDDGRKRKKEDPTLERNGVT